MSADFNSDEEYNQCELARIRAVLTPHVLIRTTTNAIDSDSDSDSDIAHDLSVADAHDLRESPDACDDSAKKKPLLTKTFCITILSVLLFVSLCVHAVSLIEMWMLQRHISLLLSALK